MRRQWPRRRAEAVGGGKGECCGSRRGSRCARQKPHGIRRDTGQRAIPTASRHASTALRPVTCLACTAVSIEACDRVWTCRSNVTRLFFPRDINAETERRVRRVRIEVAHWRGAARRLAEELRPAEERGRALVEPKDRLEERSEHVAWVTERLGEQVYEQEES